MLEPASQPFSRHSSVRRGLSLVSWSKFGVVVASDHLRRPVGDFLEWGGLGDHPPVSEDSGSGKMRPALRYSNDASTWDSSKELDAGCRTSEGISWGTSYVDITALAGTTARAWVQFGVEVANESGTRVEVCNATLRVERGAL